MFCIRRLLIKKFQHVQKASYKLPTYEKSTNKIFKRSCSEARRKYVHVVEDVVVFTDLAKGLRYDICRLAGIAIGIVLLNNAREFYISENSPVKENEENWLKTEYWQNLLGFGGDGMEKFAKMNCALFLIVYAGLFAFLPMWYISGIVQTVTLMKGGKNVTITTYAWLKRNRVIECTLKETTASRTSKQVYLNVNNNGRNRKLLLNTHRGKIYSQSLYDRTVLSLN